MKSKPKPSKPVLPKTEWNFVESKVSNRELPACWLYEYAREHFRNQEDALDTHVVLIGLNVHGLNLNGLALPIVPSFPKLSWQELNKEDREKIVQVIERQREPAIRIWSLMDWEEFLEAHPNQVKINPGMLPPYNFKRWYGVEMSDEAEQGLFAIDWSRSRGEIEADFGRWLDGMQARKASSAKKNPCEIKSALHRWRAEMQVAQEKKKTQRRGGLRDQLAWLGCLRVWNHYPHKELREPENPGHFDAEGALPVEAPVKYYPDLFRRAKDAREILAALFC